MKNAFRSIVMSFSMFSNLPMPRVEWRQENMRYALAALPLIGAVIGLLIWGWQALCGCLGLGDILYAAGVTLIPPAVTGGIHLDGFCDTVDALSSHADAEKKRAILKDPNAGAFAVIWCGAYLLLYFALATEAREIQDVLMLGLIHLISRAVTGFCSLTFPASGSQGLFATFNGSADKIVSAIITAVVFAGAGFSAVFFAGIPGGASAFSTVLCALAVYFIAKRQFNGMSGDISGFLLQISELFMLLTYIIVKRVMFL